MAGDVQDIIRQVLLNALEGSGGRASDAVRNGGSDGRGALSGVKGVVAGAGAAALIPFAVKNAGNVAKRLGIEGLDDLTNSPGGALSGLTSKLGDSVGSGIGDKLSEKVDEAGGPSGILKDSVKDALPFGGGESGGGNKGGIAGVGAGRRMPVQQSVDIGAPIETVYNQWTQFEDWPTFMHRVTRVTQEDHCTLTFATKIWGRTKEFTAKIETQRPNERIKWRVSQGMTHTGVVTFHELGANLTRVLLGFDVEPGGLLEKAARGMRHVKRAARGDLHRFKAFIEMAEKETGAWRGVIEDGELIEEHDPSYDEERDYSDLDELLEDSDEGSEEDESEEDQDEDQPDAKRSRARASTRTGGSSSRPASRGGPSSQGRSGGGSPGGTSSGSGSRSSGSRSGTRSRASKGRSASTSARSGSSGGGKSGSSRGRSGSSGNRSGSSSRSGTPRGSSSSQSKGRRTRSRGSTN